MALCRARYSSRCRPGLQQAPDVLGEPHATCALYPPHMRVMQVLVQSAAQGMYQIHTPHFVVPCLVPLLQYIFKVRCSAEAFIATVTLLCLALHVVPLSVLHIQLST